jgi:diguanylate cyclase (GGDEF)-like protein
MLKTKKFFLQFSQLCHFESKETEEQYNRWKDVSRYGQIFSVSLLTAFLYALYAQLDQMVATSETVIIRTVIHLYFIAPLLLLISFLSFFKKSMKIITFLLMFAPILAAMGNLYIVQKVDNYTTYLTEDYLIIFWIFTVSGLKLLHATISAFTTLIVVFVATYFYITFSVELFLMHSFWMVSSFSFGFLGAYLIEKSSRIIFFKNMALEKLAETDVLTGMYNRSKLNEVLKIEINRSQRYKLDFGLLILDIDYFKEINDNYGHEEGDRVLVAFSEILKQNMRLTDVLIRWGGEEFIIIYLGAQKKEILALAEKLRFAIEKHPFEKIGTKTASMGVTVYKIGDTDKSIIKRADRALYNAKENGRNRVAFL